MISANFKSRSVDYLDMSDHVSGKVVTLYKGDEYDRDIAALRYDMPQKFVQFALPYIKENLSNKEYQVLEIGAGTGAVSKRLKEAGYAGQIDGIDGSADMLKNASGLYRNQTVHILSKENPMPYPDCSYDLVVCCCAILPCCIHPDCLEDFIRVCKKGGLVIFSVDDYSKKFSAVVEQAVDALAGSIKWKLLERKSVGTFEDGIHDVSEEVERYRDGWKYSMIYCFQKL